MSTPVSTPISLQPPPSRANFMFALITALEREQTSESNQQASDAESTMLSTTMLENMTNSWNAVLKQANGVVQSINKDTPDESNAMTKAQLAYNYDNSLSNSNTSQLQGTVQAEQGQTSSDATNMQMMTQIMQSATSIMQTLTSILQSMGVVA